ncbi:rod-binding protein [Candidatus Latescibacterota bacterium]
MKTIAHNNMNGTLVRKPGTGQRTFMPPTVRNDPFNIRNLNRMTSVEKEKARLLKATEGFEAIFIREILSTMRSSLQDGGMFGDGIAGQIYGDMMDNAIAETMSKRSALGLSDMLYRTLVKNIESKEKNNAQELNSTQEKFQK